MLIGSKNDAKLIMCIFLCQSWYIWTSGIWCILWCVVDEAMEARREIGVFFLVRHYICRYRYRINYTLWLNGKLRILAYLTALPVCSLYHCAVQNFTYGIPWTFGPSLFFCYIVLDHIMHTMSVQPKLFCAIFTSFL